MCAVDGVTFDRRSPPLILTPSHHYQMPDNLINCDNGVDAPAFLKRRAGETLELKKSAETCNRHGDSYVLVAMRADAIK